MGGLCMVAPIEPGKSSSVVLIAVWSSEAHSN